MSWLSKAIRGIGNLAKGRGTLTGSPEEQHEQVLGEIQSANNRYKRNINRGRIAAAAGAGAGLALGGFGGAGAAAASKAAGSKAVSGLSVGGALKGAGKFVLGNPELVLGGIGAIGAAKSAGKADQLRSVARSDLSKAAHKYLAEPPRPDLSHIYTDPGDPYMTAARARRPAR